MAAAEIHVLLSFLRFYFRVWNPAKRVREHYVRQFFCHVHASILQTGCVSLNIHLRASAPWQRLRCMCCSSFFISTLVFGTPPTEWWTSQCWTSLRCNFAVIETRALSRLCLCGQNHASNNAKSHNAKSHIANFLNQRKTSALLSRRTEHTTRTSRDLLSNLSFSLSLSLDSCFLSLSLSLCPLSLSLSLCPLSLEGYLEVCHEI